MLKIFKKSTDANAAEETSRIIKIEPKLKRDSSISGIKTLLEEEDEFKLHCTLVNLTDCHIYDSSYSEYINMGDWWVDVDNSTIDYGKTYEIDNINSVSDIMAEVNKDIRQMIVSDFEELDKLYEIMKICSDVTIDKISLYKKVLRILWPKVPEHAIDICKEFDISINIGEFYSQINRAFSQDDLVSLHIYNEYYFCINRGSVVKFPAEIGAKMIECTDFGTIRVMKFLNNLISYIVP